METFTEYQVRTVLMQVFAGDAAAVDRMVQEMRETPRNAGALGLSDDELKGTARDEPEHKVQAVRKQVG